MTEEIWKDIKGFEGYYQASNLGRVRSLDRPVNTKGNKVAIKKGKVLSEKYKDQNGYPCVGLCKEGKTYHMGRHKAVALAFLDNPNNLPCINHKDENPENNCVENLEWCTYQYNNTYGHRIEKSVAKRINGKSSKPILQFTRDGEFVREFPSESEVYREYGYDRTKISLVARGLRKTAYNHIWRFREEVKS